MMTMQKAIAMKQVSGGGVGGDGGGGGGGVMTDHDVHKDNDIF